MPLINKMKLVTAAGMLVLLAGCNVVGGSPEPIGPSGPVARPMVSDFPVRVGAPYQIAGRTWTPIDQLDYDEVGYASWYGAELDGAPTANGEAFYPGGVTAAHRTLPLPSYVEVTRLDTGRTILVRINDRGPADPNRLIDLSAGAAEQLGITESGMVPVRVRRTNPSESERVALRSGLPVQERLDTPDSLLEIMRERAARLPLPSGYVAPARRPDGPRSPNAGPIAAPGDVPAGPGPWIVQVGAYSSRASADVIARRIGAQVVQSGNLYRVRYGPFSDATEAQAAVARARRAGQPGAVIMRAP
jgi:rare lipoprotein A